MFVFIALKDYANVPVIVNVQKSGDAKFGNTTALNVAALNFAQIELTGLNGTVLSNLHCRTTVLCRTKNLSNRPVHRQNMEPKACWFFFTPRFRTGLATIL